MSAPIAIETNLGAIELLRGAMRSFYAAFEDEGIAFPSAARTPERMIKFLIAGRLYARAHEVAGWCVLGDATTTDEAAGLLEDYFHKYLDYASRISADHAAGWRREFEQSAWRGGGGRVIQGAYRKREAAT